MNLRTAACIVFLIMLSFASNGQGGSVTVCTGLGQNPSTAFPVCGVASFEQKTVQLCGNRKVPNGACRDNLTDINPYWYKFTCFESGTLGFLITPNNLDDDYDWQLFDITGRKGEDIYTDPALIVGSNWSGEVGLTGASSAGRNINICGGGGQPLFSSMPQISKGHDYLLLVSHFTNTQSGYKLAFGGTAGTQTNGTASITDPKPPLLSGATASCDASSVTVTLNKKMRCKSLATDGSDFILSGTAATIIGASAPACSNGFDMETVVLTLSNPLPVGNYSITSRSGTDGNTITDNCDNAIPSTQNVSFAIVPLQPTPMDSLVSPNCAPDYLTLVFKKNMLCSSIAANGSDFTVTGPAGVAVTGATGTCDASGYSKVIRVQLSAPIQTGGTYTITLRNGSDGNTLTDECARQTPVGSAISFQMQDTVSAAFTYNIALGCKTDTISFDHDGLHNVTSWNWSLGDNKTSTVWNPVAYYTLFGEKRISLIVSNGMCSDTTTETVNLNNAIDAKFGYPDIVCPEEPATFTDASTGALTSWAWNFGNGFASAIQNPSPQPYQLPPLTRELNYTVQLIIGNEIGCFDTTSVSIKAVSSCYIAVPSAFTPNRDGRNDFLYPLNAFKSTGLSFKVFNRYGQVVFESTDWRQKWDGNVNGRIQPAGTYVWILNYTETDTGKKVSLRGSSVLVR